MSYFRPASVTIFAIVLFVAWNWISMSGVNYDGRLRISTFTTAGWFVLGFPFIAACALAYSAFVAYLFRRQRWMLAAACLLIVITMLAKSGYACLPENRVRRIVGSDVGSNVTVYRLLTMDGFSEGVVTVGIISGSEKTLKMIANERKLQLTDEVPLGVLRRVFPDDGLPEHAAAYINDRSTFYFHSDTGRIYFRW